MRIIRLTEEQYKMLIEGNYENAGPNFNSKQQDYTGSETTVTSNVTNSNGELERGKPVSTDDLADTMTTQNYWYQSPKSVNIK